MAALGWALLLTSCSTKKKGIINRSYHNLTSKYNGYWNGREAQRQGVKTLEANHPDDYERILDVFPFGSQATASSAQGDMNRAIDKGSMVIAKHSMLIKGKEYCNWIDDSYMLIGKSHFLKRDYMDALEIFNYVVKQYRETPSRFEGYIWLMRTNTAMARMKDAEKMITQLDEDREALSKKKEKKAFAKLETDIATSKADYYINNAEYGNAKDELRKAIKGTKRSRTKTRYMYILAQLYQEVGARDSAVHFYTQVLKKNTPYVMEFNARINRALLTSASSGNLEAIKKELVKMSKDAKNVDFLDRIYFALGNIALEEGDKDLAMGYLKKSVAASTTNPTQKAVSYFTIADLYYEKPEFLLASAYYDSSMALLPDRHPQHPRVEARQESLAELVKNIRIIAHEDSMLRLGNMSESQLDAYIEGLIAEVRAKEEKRKAEEEAAAAAAAAPVQQQPTTPGRPTGGAGWYFYNPSALSFGTNDYRQRWGQRKLEDNWRRSNKQTELLAQGEDPGAEKADAAATVTEMMTPAYYKKNVPRSDAEKDSAHKRIQYAFYDLGTIYKDKLQENARAIETFEELLRRYPAGMFPMETCYQLYRLCHQMGDMAKANEYKQRILRQWPDSDYAKILSDPNYLQKLEALKAQLGIIYDKAFTNFRNGEHEMVIATCDSVLAIDKDSKLRPKYSLLRAMSIGATERLITYRKALEDVIRTYPAAPEKDKAEELLGYVKKMMGEVAENTAAQPDGAPAEEGYVFDAEANQYFAMTVGKGVTVADVKGRLSNFNAKSFSTETLIIKNVRLSNESELVFIQGFRSLKMVKDYLMMLWQDAEALDGIDPNLLSPFILSEKNFPLFYKRKDIPEYMAFYGKHYM